MSSLERDAATQVLFDRRSVAPKRLGSPGPEAADLARIVAAALHAPDHGGLHPWRVIEFTVAHRDALADAFEEEKLRRDPLASKSDLLRAREHATRPPALLAFVVSPEARSAVPVREQWLAAGAALGNLLNATHMLGFGGIVLSGERCFDAVLTERLGVADGEFLAGFVSIGSVVTQPPDRSHASLDEVWSSWTPTSVKSPLSSP